MRLGQLARKYEVQVHDIVKYLDSLDALPESVHPNAKVDEEVEALVSNHFGLPAEEKVEESISEASEEATATIKEEEKSTIEKEEESISYIEAELSHESETDEEIVSIKEEEQIAEEIPNKIDRVSIDSDKLLEMLESEEISEEIERITLIKAPKKELKSLKIVGKIDLPEPKPTTQPEKENDLETSSKPEGAKEVNIRSKNRGLTKEQREERRQRARINRENEAKRLEKLRMKAEEDHKKLIREAHYKKKLQSKKLANNPKKQVIVPEDKDDSEPLIPPKTWIGKFLRWLNTE